MAIVHEDQETRRHASTALIAEAIRAIFEALDALPDSPKKRALRCTTGTYQRALAGWTYARPSEIRRTALREVVFNLHTQVMEMRRIASSHENNGTDPVAEGEATTRLGPVHVRRR